VVEKVRMKTLAVHKRMMRVLYSEIAKLRSTRGSTSTSVAKGRNSAINYIIVN